MTEKDEKLIAEFELRMRQLMYFCDSLKEENARLKQHLTEKDSMIAKLSLDVEELKSKYDNLKFVKSISSADTSDQMLAKKRLSKLVRDVDKCISMLKN